MMTIRLATRLWWWRHLYSRLRERMLMAVAWRLPRSLVSWCAIRVAAHATTGRYGDTVVPELGAMEALRRWDG
jgi:hypothetical protein